MSLDTTAMDSRLSSLESRTASIAKASPTRLSNDIPAASLPAPQTQLDALVTALTSVTIHQRIFLTLSEAADYSGLPSGFLKQLINDGRLRALKTGAGWRIPRLALEELAR
jgi:excisionase family DNA binding protein